MSTNPEKRKRFIFIVYTLVLLAIPLSLIGFYGTQEAAYIPYDGPPGDTRVLFVGNSYTHANNLPQVFSELASSGGYNASAALLARGGWTLLNHLTGDVTRETIQPGAWDYVVLQEQSVIPSIPTLRSWLMYPVARRQAAQIEKAGAQTVLFMTWGHHDNSSPSGQADYLGMQAQIETGYLTIADELGLPVAPVGIAWQEALSRDPQFDPWRADGSHPNHQGTYLAACVFYAVIFQKSPEGLAFLAGLDDETAHFLQTVAAQTVFEDPERWHIE